MALKEILSYFNIYNILLLFGIFFIFQFNIQSLLVVVILYIILFIFNKKVNRNRVLLGIFLLFLSIFLYDINYTYKNYIIYISFLFAIIIYINFLQNKKFIYFFILSIPFIFMKNPYFIIPFVLISPFFIRNIFKDLKENLLRLFLILIVYFIYYFIIIHNYFLVGFNSFLEYNLNGIFAFIILGTIGWILSKVRYSLEILFLEFVFLYPFLSKKFLYLDNILYIIIIIYLFKVKIDDLIKLFKQDKIVLSLSILFVIFLISNIISVMLWSGNSYYFTADSQYFYEHFVFYFMLLIILLTYINKEWYSYILNSFVVAMFISEIVSYSIFFGLIDIDYWKSVGLLYVKTSMCDPSPFSNHIKYSVFLVIAIIISIYNLIYEKAKNNIFKIISILFLISSFINIFLNGGRTGQLLLIITIFLVLLKFSKSKFQFFKRITILGIILFVIFNIDIKCGNKISNSNKRLLLGISNIHNISNDEKYYLTSWGQRVALNTIFITYLTSSPERFVFGSGASREKSEINKFVKENMSYIFKIVFERRNTIHSDLFSIWLYGGIFAVLLWLYILWLLVKKCSNALIYSLVFVIVVFSLQDKMIISPHGQKYVLFLFIIMFIYILSGKLKEKNECFNDFNRR